MLKFLHMINAWLKKLNGEIEIPFKKSKGNEGVIVLGHYASQLVRNPAFDAALRKIEDDIFNAWKTSPPKSRLEREHLYYRMEGLAQIKLKLAGMVNNMLLEEKKAKQTMGQAERNPEQESEQWN